MRPKKASYDWLIKQIDKLEKAVINQCGFCLGDDKTPQIPVEFSEGASVSPDKLSNTMVRRITDIRRLEEFINHYEFIAMEEMLISRREGKSVAKWQSLLNRLENSRKIIDKESDIIQYEIDFSTNRSIDTLSKISFIFLPLSFIVGYFGMNFTSMGMVGHNVDKQGILMWKYGHIFIKFLLIVSLCLSIGYLYYLQSNESLKKTAQKEVDRLTDIQATASDS
jgi:hypothetical protein